MDEATFGERVKWVKAKYVFLSSKRQVWDSPVVASVALCYRDDPDRFLPWLIEKSKANMYAWNGLCMIASHLLDAGEPLPNLLASWVAGVLSDLGIESQGPARIAYSKKIKRHPRPSTGSPLLLRDARIRAAIRDLRSRYGLAATRSRSASPTSPGLEQRSACDVVATATSMSYGNVERIWLSRRRRI